jgi:hypothetical protein
VNVRRRTAGGILVAAISLGGLGGACASAEEQQPGAEESESDSESEGSEESGDDDTGEDEI